MSTLRPNILVMPQEIYTSSSTQGTDLGASSTTGDGRYFRYVKAGATTLVQGTVQCAPAGSNANWGPSGGLTVGAATVTGATQFNLNSSITLAANDLAGGIMSVVVTPGIGYTYKVKSNTAVTAATGATITLEDPLQTNLSTASRVVFYASKYNGVVQMLPANLSAIVGVAVYPVTNAQYGWVQTRGPIGVLIGYNSNAGYPVGSNLVNTTGGVAAATGFQFFTPIGNLMATGVSGEYDMVDLFLE